MIKTVNCNHFGSYCHCDMMTLGLYKIHFLIIEEFLAALQCFIVLFCHVIAAPCNVDTVLGHKAVSK